MINFEGCESLGDNRRCGQLRVWQVLFLSSFSSSSSSSSSSFSSSFYSFSSFPYLPLPPLTLPPLCPFPPLLRPLSLLCPFRLFFQTLFLKLVSRSDIIMPEGAKPGDVLLLTKPLGTQVNLSVWTVTLFTYSIEFVQFPSSHTVYTVHLCSYLVHLHCTLLTVHCKLYTVNCTLCTVHCTLYTIHCALYTVLCTLYGVNRTPYTVHRTPYTVHCTLYPVLYTVQ